MSKENQTTDQFQFPVKFKAVPQGAVVAPINGGVLFSTDFMDDLNSHLYHSYVDRVELMAHRAFLKKIGRESEFEGYFSWDNEC